MVDGEPCREKPEPWSSSSLVGKTDTREEPRNSKEGASGVTSLSALDGGLGVGRKARLGCGALARASGGSVTY